MQLLQSGFPENERTAKYRLGNIFEECGDNIDSVWNKFINKYIDAEWECIPSKIIKTGKKRFTYPLDRKSLGKRKKKYRLWKRDRDTKDMKIYEDCCRCRNQVRRLTRKAVKQQEKGIAEKVKSNNKVFWKFINSKAEMRSAIPELYTTSQHDTNKMTNNDREKANILGNFFSSVYTKEPEWTWVLDKDEKPRIRKELKLEITKEAVRQKLTKIKSNKFPGPDTMHPSVMKEMVDVLVSPFYLIFKLSIKLGKIPMPRKLANGSAIYKNKGSKHSPENFRPISLTSIACKILESIIREAILAYLKDNSLLS